jgi:tetratricopeptide (TPR) repeat protein
MPLETWLDSDGIVAIRASRLIKTLSSKTTLLKHELIDAIRAETGISEAIRSKALKLAELYDEPAAMQLNHAAWLVARRRDMSQSDYARALRHADAAVRLVPESGEILNTLGVAQYRVGQYEQALETLSHSEQLNATDKEMVGPLPGDLAFQTMAHHKLGHKEEAKKLLTRLREIAKQDRWSDDVEAQMFLREAEALIEAKPPAPPPPTTKPD